MTLKTNKMFQYIIDLSAKWGSNTYWWTENMK